MRVNGVSGSNSNGAQEGRFNVWYVCVCVVWCVLCGVCVVWCVCVLLCGVCVVRVCVCVCGVWCVSCVVCVCVLCTWCELIALRYSKL